MCPEIKQPRMIRLPDDLNDPLASSKLKIVHVEWLRAVAPQLGLDASKLVLGFTLANMMGHDANAFVPTIIFNEAYANSSKESVLILLNLEGQITELPKELRKQVRSTKDRLLKLDWTILSEYNQARCLWRKLILEYTTNFVAQNHSLKSAMDYERDNYEILVQYWNNFLHGTPVDVEY